MLKWGSVVSNTHQHEDILEVAPGCSVLIAIQNCNKPHPNGRTNHGPLSVEQFATKRRLRIGVDLRTGPSARFSFGLQQDEDNDG
jgi:hypothetical protein